jgi:hypothetical protein
VGGGEATFTFEDFWNRQISSLLFEHKVAGQGGLDGDVDGLLVAHLADEHDVGVLAEEAPQAGGEGQADFLLDLDLVDTPEVVLNRILGCDDVGLRRVERFRDE